MKNKNVIFYILIAVVISIFSASTLETYRKNKYLSSTIPHHIKLNERLTKDKIKLLLSNESYKQQIDYLNKELDEQVEQFKELDSRIKQLELLLNERTIKTITREKKIQNLEHNASQKLSLLRTIPSGNPTANNERITSRYGKRIHPISKMVKFHQGMDLACKIGDEILAPADGVVETIRPGKKGVGNFLTLRHDFGFMTSYAHLSKFLTKSGRIVKKGDVIATCGMSGDTTGPHLHYEIRFLGRRLDPEIFLRWSMRDFSSPFRKIKLLDLDSIYKTLQSRDELNRIYFK